MEGALRVQTTTYDSCVENDIKLQHRRHYFQRQIIKIWRAEDRSFLQNVWYLTFECLQYYNGVYNHVISIK